MNRYSMLSHAGQPPVSFLFNYAAANLCMRIRFKIIFRALLCINFLFIGISMLHAQNLNFTGLSPTISFTDTLNSKLDLKFFDSVKDPDSGENY